MLSDKKRREFADKYAKQMSVKMVDVNQFVSNLSGGNKQKVVLARWIGKDSDIVVLDSPTRGIDIKVKQDIYQLMNQMRKNGKSIIMISEEIMELLGMADRILIMKDGLFVTCRVPFSLNVVFVREEGQKLMLHNTIDNIHRFIQF